ncbi:MAG: TrmH family RNA methyltransferase [Salinivirgaceae bacterium]
MQKTKDNITSVITDLSGLNGYLKEFISTKRKALFEQVIQNRTRYISVALEDIYQPHNASAVLRTCDCFGIQDVHVIENQNKYQVNPDVALGSSQWVNIVKHNRQEHNTLNTIQHLKENGYRIVATTPHTNDVTLDKLNLDEGKIALFFGTEMRGLSQTMLDHADTYLKIPMFGFTESFNISVSASIILHHLTHKLHQSELNWQLSDFEKEQVQHEWLKRTIKKVNLIIDDYCKKNQIDYSKITAL